jgi:hypothetical protein
LAFTLVATGQARAKNHVVPFEGKHVYEEQTGLTALPDEAHEHLFLSSLKHHFWLVLPYSETWVLETGKNLPLDAKDERYIVSIRVEPRGKTGDEAFLRQKLAELAQGEDERAFDALFFDVHDRSILRVKSRGAEGSWAWTYRVVTPRKDRWYLLTLTVQDAEPLDTEHEEQILDILGVGFGADFDLD